MQNQNSFPFPNDNIDPKKKGSDKFGLKVGKAIWNSDLLNMQSTQRKKDIRENRSFASNNQSVDQYKPLLNASIDQSGDISAMNIDWSISTPCQKFTNNMIGDIINQDHKIQFNSISPYTRTRREADRDEYFQKMVMEMEISAIEEQTGVAFQEKKGFMPKDEDEINLYMDMEYRQPVEIGMEEIVDFELYNNDWEKKVKNRVVRDIVENNEGRCRLYFDENGKIRLRYTDIENYVSSHTVEPDSSDVDYEAEMVMMSIGNLRLRDKDNKLTEADWRKVANAHSKKHGNPFFDSNNYSIDYNYDDFRIPVLDFIYYTNNKTSWEERKTKHGRNFFDKKGFGHTSEKNNVINKEREVSYDGLWIVNTDFLLNYGLSENMLRHKNPHQTEKTSPKLVRRYVSYKIPGKSIVKIMQPNVNNIQLLVLRKRHIIAEINPTGLAIDINGLTDVMQLMEMENPRELISLYKQKGIMLFSRSDVNGDPANGIPVQELASQFADLLVSLDNSILSEINIIRENIGYSEGRDGTKQDKNALVGIEKLRLLASNNTTREVYNGYLNGILAPIGKVISRMVQYKIMYGGGISEYEDVIGKVGVKSLEFVKDIPMSEMGIKIEALPTAEELQDLMNALNISLERDEIKVEDTFEVKSVMNIKKAIRFLKQKRKKYSEEKALANQQKEQFTAEREAASIKASAEAEKIKAIARAEGEVMVEDARTRLKKEYNDHETMNEIKKIDRENYWKIKLIEEAQDEDDENSDKSKSPSEPTGSGVKIFSDPTRSATRKDAMM
jgi:hypothetical protein